MLLKELKRNETQYLENVWKPSPKAAQHKQKRKRVSYAQQKDGLVLFLVTGTG
jgi:hypothetical protein